MKYYDFLIEWIKRQTFLILYLIPLVLGVTFAYFTVNRYAIFVRAFLGLSVIFFLVLIIRMARNRSRTTQEIDYEVPNYLRIFRNNFLLSVIVSWAIVQIFKLILYLFQLLQDVIDI